MGGCEGRIEVSTVGRGPVDQGGRQARWEREGWQEGEGGGGRGGGREETHFSRLEVG